MLLSPLQEMSNVSFSDIRYKQLECVLQVGVLLRSSFVIRVNLLHPLPSLFLYGLLSSLWSFSFLVNYNFNVSFNLR